MLEASFFQAIEAHWREELPFVVYRKPNSTLFKVLLQENAEVYKTENFKEPGFVFAPFDNEKEAILLRPDKQLCYIENTISNSNILDSSNSRNKSLPVNKIEKSKHLTLVNKALMLLKNNTLQKVVLSRKEKVEITECDPLGKFKNLSLRYPTAMVYCWCHPQIGMWLGATPETLLHVSENRLKTMALAGTQPYDGTIAIDWGEKELQEQQLVTKAILNGLTPLVKGISFSEVYTHRAGSLLHLRTDIKADMEEFSLRELIETLHPTPAVCGLPMESAKRFILENENYDRTFYTGFLGEIMLSSQENKRIRETNLFVNLRCMQLKDKEVVLYVGGGITKASNPEMEWEETVRKTNTMKSVL